MYRSLDAVQSKGFHCTLGASIAPLPPPPPPPPLPLLLLPTRGEPLPPLPLRGESHCLLLSCCFSPGMPACGLEVVGWGWTGGWGSGGGLRLGGWFGVSRRHCRRCRWCCAAAKRQPLLSFQGGALHPSVFNATLMASSAGAQVGWMALMSFMSLALGSGHLFTHAACK